MWEEAYPRGSAHLLLWPLVRTGGRADSDLADARDALGIFPGLPAGTFTSWTAKGGCGGKAAAAPAKRSCSTCCAAGGSFSHSSKRQEPAAATSPAAAVPEVFDTPRMMRAL